jgi:hypothetical protein
MDSKLHDLLGRALALPLPPEVRAGLPAAAAIAEADPEMALARVRKVLEMVVREAYERCIAEPSGTRPLENLVQRLTKDGHLPKRIAAYANVIRDLGNAGVHAVGEQFSAADVVLSLEQLLPVLEWHVGQGAISHSDTPRGSSGPVSNAVGVPPARDPIDARGAALRTWCIALAVIAVFLVTGGVFWFHRSRSSLPSWVAALPAGKVLRVIFDEAPPAGVAGEPLRARVEIFVRKWPEKEFHPVTDGASLSAADEYVIAVQAGSHGYVYVFQLDHSGKLTWLAPRNESQDYSAGKNPVQIEDVVQVPGPKYQSLELDGNPGIEHIYVVLSRTRWLQLEEALQAVAAQASPDDRSPGPTVDQPLDLTRGVGGARVGPPLNLAPSAERKVAGESQDLKFVSQVTETDGPVLVLERWFRQVAPPADKKGSPP